MFLNYAAEFLQPEINLQDLIAVQYPTIQTKICIRSCEDSDHKIDVLNLGLPIITVSLPLIVVRDSINKVTQTLLRAQTLLENTTTL